MTPTQPVQPHASTFNMTTSHPLSHSHFYHQAHASSSSNQEPPERIFVRARFDFQASDPSALNFKSGDVIEVITRLQSGWWDGMLGRRRGWFPSNYVEEVELDPGPEDSGDSGAEGEGDWGLEDLARELMGDAGLEGMVGGKDEEGRDFEAAAAERRRRLNKQDEGGGGGREREGTDQTVREPQPSGMSRLSEGSGRGRREEDGEEGDAWVPCLSPDGRVSLSHSTSSHLLLAFLNSSLDLLPLRATGPLSPDPDPLTLVTQCRRQILEPQLTRLPGLLSQHQDLRKRLGDPHQQSKP